MAEQASTPTNFLKLVCTSQGWHKRRPTKKPFRCGGVLLYFTTRVFSVRFHSKCGPPGDDEKIRPDRRTRWRQNVALFRGVGLAIDKSAILYCQERTTPHCTRGRAPDPSRSTFPQKSTGQRQARHLYCQERSMRYCFRGRAPTPSRSTLSRSRGGHLQVHHLDCQERTTLHCTQGRAPDPSRSTLSRKTAGH